MKDAEWRSSIPGIASEFTYDFGKFIPMARVIREPIQVYLTPDERAELDRTAKALGVSRSEVLRRGSAYGAIGSVGCTIGGNP